MLQRLALVAGLAAGAWCAAEGLDHGTAWADDPPIRIEQEATEQPGGLLDSHPSDTEQQPPAEPTPPPDTEPDDEQTAEPDRPRSDDDAGEVDTPDPTDGDDGRPQHPVDTPPDPGPTDPPPVIPDLPLPDVELPADPDPRPTTPPGDETPNTGQPTTPVEEPLPVNDEPVTEQPKPAAGSIEADYPLFGGEHQPAPYVELPVDDVQTEPRTGDPVCDSRGVTPAAPRPGARGRLPFPRGAAGPGPTLDICDLAAAGGGGAPPLLKPPSGDPLPGAPPADHWLPQPERPHLVADRHNDRLPPSRLTLWPPRPG